MRVGIYNRYWNTFGGGEKHVGAIAATLAAQPGMDVTLIGTEPFSVEALVNRFHLDLQRCRTAIWPNRPCEELAPLSGGYDLFINSTYCSSMPATARRSVYLCFFPQTIVGAPPVDGETDSIPSAPLPVAGHHHIDSAGRCWFGEHGVVRIPLPSKRPRYVSVPMVAAPHAAFRHMRVAGSSVPWSTNQGGVQIDVGSLDLPADSDAIDLFFEASLREKKQTPDDLNTRLLRVFLEVPRTSVLPDRPSHTSHPDWLSTYDTIVANSQYTAGWIRRRWNRESVILPPPIDTTVFSPPPPGSARRPIILSVGRFFAGSHNKKHDVLIEVFRAMIDSGRLTRDWELHLVGGRHRELPQHIEYYEHLLRLAEGYPVRFFPDIAFSELLKKYRESSLYWHAAGMNECEDSAPDRFEHFGVTTCEAMACGLIPVVINRAGQREIIQDGVNGFAFSTKNELIAKTASAIALLGSREGQRLAEAARTAAERYSIANYGPTIPALLADRVQPRDSRSP